MNNCIAHKSKVQVSVIVPVFKVQKYLAECLDSITRQTLNNIEIICVNDASPDNCQSILESYANNDNRLILLTHEQNRGLAAARNTGIDKATGEYITFIDSDDFYARRDALELLYKNAIIDDADEVIGGIIKWEEETNNKYLDWHENYLTQEVHGKSLLEFSQLRANVIAVNKLIRSSILNNNKIRFNEAIRKHEDNPFSIQIHIFSKKISIINKTTYIYRQAENGSIMSTVKKTDALYRCLYCFDIFQFIESETDRHKYRNIFYPMYTNQIIGSAVILNSFSNTDDEKSDLFNHWKKIADLLPESCPGIPEHQITFFELIKNDDIASAWNFAIQFNNQLTPSSSTDLAELEALNYILAQQILLTKNSTSWKITKPFRWIYRKLIYYKN